jgi:hypothetical protein
MVVKEASPGLYLFKFFHPMDVEEVLKGGPWTFDNFTLIIERLQVGIALHDIQLFHVNFWVQIHNVPIGMMLEKVGKGLANYIGEFLEYDKNNNTSFWRNYMRVKVRFDVRKPLRVEKKISVTGGGGGFVKFKYEDLVFFALSVDSLVILRVSARLNMQWKETMEGEIGRMKSEQKFAVLAVVLNPAGCVRKGVVRLILMLAAKPVKRGTHGQGHLSLTQLNRAQVLFIMLVMNWRCCRITTMVSQLSLSHWLLDAQETILCLCVLQILVPIRCPNLPSRSYHNELELYQRGI